MRQIEKSGFWDIPLERRALGVALLTGFLLSADTGETQRHPFVLLQEGEAGFEQYLKQYVQLENTGRIPRIDDKSSVGGVWTRQIPQEVQYDESFAIGFEPRIKQGSEVRHAITVFTAELAHRYPQIQRPGSYRIIGIATGANPPHELLIPQFSVHRGDILNPNNAFKLSVDTVGIDPRGNLLRNRAPNGEKIIRVS